MEETNHGPPEGMSAEDASKELIKQYSKLIYKTSNSDFGKTAEAAAPPKHGHSTKFSSPLAYSGMFKCEGLNTTVDKERYVDGSKDWMDKIN
jgi:hypothetical protein